MKRFTIEKPDFEEMMKSLCQYNKWTKAKEMEKWWEETVVPVLEQANQYIEDLES
jgi:hypothetical protein